MLEHKVSNKHLTLIFNDQSSKNALSLKVAESMVELIYKNKPTSLLVTAKGRVFCSGGQLKEYAKMETKEEGLATNERIRKALAHIDSLPIPKVAVVNGFCFGGGIEFISCFDHIVCTPAAFFGLWQRKIGLSYGWGGKARLEHRLGAQKLYSWYVSGELMSAYKAREIGLVDGIATYERALESARDRLLKSRKMSSAALEVSQQGLTEVQVFENLWLSPDHQKALAPFRT